MERIKQLLIVEQQLYGPCYKHDKNIGTMFDEEIFPCLWINTFSAKSPDGKDYGVESHEGEEHEEHYQEAIEVLLDLFFYQLISCIVI